MTPDLACCRDVPVDPNRPLGRCGVLCGTPDPRKDTDPCAS